MTAALAALMRRIHGMTTEPMVLRFGCKATSGTDIAAAEAWSESCNLKSARAAKTDSYSICLAVLHGQLFSLQFLDFSLCRLVYK
jgi:hypothetical protein